MGVAKQRNNALHALHEETKNRARQFAARPGEAERVGEAGLEPATFRM